MSEGSHVTLTYGTFDEPRAVQDRLFEYLGLDKEKTGVAITRVGGDGVNALLLGETVLIHARVQVKVPRAEANRILGLTAGE